MQARLFPAPANMQSTTTTSSFYFGDVTLRSTYKNISLTCTAPIKGKVDLPPAEEPNPHCQAVHDQFMNWIQEIKLAAKESHDENSKLLNAIYNKAEQLKVAWLFSTPLRNLPAKALLSLIKFTYFLFVIDDFFDKDLNAAVGSQETVIEKIEQISNCFYDILSGKNIQPLPRIAFPTHEYFAALCRAAFDIRSDLENENQTDPTPFLSEFKNYFDSILDEIKTRQQQSSCAANDNNNGSQTGDRIKEYMKQRTYTGGVIVTFERLNKICDANPSNKIRELPLFKQFLTTSSEALGVFNDKVSCYKEAQENDHHNLISVQYDVHTQKMIDYLDQFPAFNKAFPHEQGEVNISWDQLSDFLHKEKINLKEALGFDHPLQQAIKDAENKHNELMQATFDLYQRLIKEVKKLPNLNEAISELFILKMYCKNIIHCLHDNAFWSVEITKRYNLGKINFCCDFANPKVAVTASNNIIRSKL